MVINESKSALIYHGTTFGNACKILESNKLIANKSNSTETVGISFTRNRNEAYDDACIALNQEAISYNYKISPVYRDGIAGRDLAEERVPNTINNVRKYIYSLH